MNYDLVSIICAIAVAGMVVLAFYFEYGPGEKKIKTKKNKLTKGPSCDKRGSKG